MEEDVEAGPITDLANPAVWPGVLTDISSDSARFLMKGISAVLVETQDTGYPWLFYSGRSFAKVLDNLGLHPET